MSCRTPFRSPTLYTNHYLSHCGGKREGDGETERDGHGQVLCTNISKSDKDGFIDMIRNALSFRMMNIGIFGLLKSYFHNSLTRTRAGLAENRRRLAPDRGRVGSLDA